MQHQPAYPSILAAITVARSLDEQRFQQLVTALDNATLPLTASVLQVQRLLHFSAAESRTVVGLLHQWQTWGKDIQSLAIALQTARVTSAVTQTEAPSVSLVWTGPISLPGSTRTTGSVLIDLIDHAQQEIVIVDYTLSENSSYVRRIIAHLARAHQRGVQIVLIGDQVEEKQLPVLKAYWPPNQELPLLYTRKAPTSDSKSALHAKAMVVDGNSLLATSANLSYHGLAGNIELGLLVEGRVAQEAVTLLKLLITEEVCVKVDANKRS
jgi:phosphatidylserine/phosphatidylglycerophosphate/cardiolipin synthase-like enzyme